MHDADENTGQQVMLQMFVRSRGSDSSERFAEVPTFLSSFPIPDLDSQHCIAKMDALFAYGCLGVVFLVYFFPFSFRISVVFLRNPASCGVVVCAVGLRNHPILCRSQQHASVSDDRHRHQVRQSLYFNGCKSFLDVELAAFRRA